ncbi:MAG: DUF1727 domain-containing protein [Ktedonobacteraceae bacterium]|nr:DUF1727 domain-containing protein [Ktedonobacteraceae bacterium]
MREGQPVQPASSLINMKRQRRRTEKNGQRGREERKQADIERKRRVPQRRISLRAGLAVIAGRAAGAVSRRLHLGGGTSITGEVAQRVYPDIAGYLATQLEHGSILVTGTNGKTTTSSFISAILQDAGLRVWRNREGSNLMRGIASSLVMRALPSGNLKRAGRAISVLEVDEAALPQIVQTIHPRVVVFTNLFRDQLDRYGEVDAIIERWRKAISALPLSTTLVLNADDPAVAGLDTSFNGRTLYYGIDDLSLDLLTQESSEQRHQVIDTRRCPRCGSDYCYEARFFSHLGHYHCPQCTMKRPQPAVRATHVQRDGFDRLRIEIATGETLDGLDERREIVVPLPGLYNVYNALAAIGAALASGVEGEAIASGIEQFKPVFGRGERIQVEGRTLRLLLAKNPTGFNEVLRTLFSDGVPRHLLFVLNDRIADGQDISWIWDVDFERVAGQTLTLTVAGTRALDLALRLKYAGVKMEDMQIIPSIPIPNMRRRNKGRPHIIRRTRHTADVARVDGEQEARQAVSPLVTTYGLNNALNRALEQTPAGETLFVVPTYTGLLEVHHELESRGLAPRYWEGKDA